MKARAAFFLITWLALIGCTSAPTLKSVDVRPWSKSLESEYPGRQVIIAHYHKGSYDLYDLTARHATDFGSDTLNTVQNLFDKYIFGAVVIEPIPYSSGESPKWFLEYAQKGRNEKFIMGGESSLSALLASERHIPFFGGEPDHQEIYRALKAKGYSNLDIIAFYAVRQIPQWVNEHAEQKHLIEREVPPFTRNDCKMFTIKDCPTLAQITNWYQEKIGRPLDVDVRNEDLAPLSDGKLFTQRLSSDVGFVRDHFTVTVIENLLRRYKKVAVVYGASHFITLRKSFDSSLGTPEFILEAPTVNK